MGRKTRRCDELGDIGACSICENCIEKRHPWYYCAESNDDFGNVDYPEDCEDFEFKSDEDDDDDDFDDDFDPNKPIDCPECGANAFWGGSNYECEDCGWCGLPDDD